MANRTVLNDRHRALGARMVDFGGWDMPLHYGSQIDEHHQVRRDAGMFDVSHMTVVDLHGPRTREFLRRLVANSVDKLHKPGKALYTCMLNEQGGVIDDLIVYFLEEDRFRLVVNRVSSREEGQQTADKIRLVAQQFLKLDIPLLGTISDDANVSKSVKRQIPFSSLYPDTAAARELKELAKRYCASRTDGAAAERQEESGGVKRFLSRMLRFMK